MDARTLVAVFAVCAVSFLYFGWRLWSLQSAKARPGTKLAALTDAQRRERLKHVAAMSVLLGMLMLGFGVWLWMRSGG
jgi:TRAP-type C4-dicarboxylate transport system permease small subunit